MQQLYQDLRQIMTSKYSSEADLETAFCEYIKDDLLWPQNEIVRQFSVQVGHETKRGDILFANSIVVEVKAQGINLYDQHIIGQLMSYMRIKRKRFGILIGNEFLFFYDDYSDKVNDLKYVLKASFKDGSSLVVERLLGNLHAQEFKESVLVDFCKEQYQKNGEKHAMQLISGGRTPSKSRTSKSSPSLAEKNIFWGDFQKRFADKDKDGILRQMCFGGTPGLFIRPKATKDLLGKKHGIQFGISNGNRADTYKVEVRFDVTADSKAAFTEYFEPHLQEIIADISNIGGIYSTSAPKSVINCFFPIAGNPDRDMEITFEKYQQFKSIIKKYYKDK